MRTSGRVMGVLFFLTAAGPALGGVTFGQVDTFSDGTVLSWTAGGGGHPSPPRVEPGGPGGPADLSLRLTARGGTGPGSRLAAFNLAQWAGDYTAAGVTRITMDVRNFGPSDVSLRLAIIDLDGGAPVNFAITDAVLVPAGSDWMPASFEVDAAALITLTGTSAGALAGADELRVFHNPAPDYPEPPTGPPAINAVLGVDNITAVPGPGAAAALLAACVPALRRRRA